MGNQLTMTQELIADMLQDLGVIRYRRGRITVLDRGSREQLCCACYAVVKKESDRSMPTQFKHAMKQSSSRP
jgi:hypothetical protein